MKANKLNIASVAMAALTVFTGCTGDLDVQPLNPSVITGKDAYTDAESYTKGLNKIYSVWALSGQDGPGSSDIAGLDPGNTALTRCWFTLQEQTTDEMKNAWPDSWCAEINGLNWSDNKIEPIEGVYQRCMYIVATSNEFLRNIDNAPAEINKVQYRAEARFCRALAYSVLLDMFGRPPFVDENYNAQPAQKTRAELFDWVISELQDIRENLPGQRACYGRADKGADDFLQARLFLNAEVYTGTARYSDCIEACKRVMDGGYKLASNYADLFRADNGENPDTKQEIIFPVCFDGITAKSYGMGALVLGSRSSSDFGDVVTYPDGLRAASGVNGGWDGYRSTQNLTNKFEYADAENKNPSNILDKRGIFNDHNGGCSQNITTAVKGTFTTEGWAVYKYTNITSKGLNGKDMAFPDTDFPMFRLGDVYLMYAEAVARGGQGGSMSEAVRLVNELRARGYGDHSRDINAGWLTQDNFRNILDERSRELYWEGTRRTDLIRYGLFTSASYVWPDKGGVITGVGVEPKYDLFPIPQTDLSVNGNLTQNPGYGEVKQ